MFDYVADASKIRYTKPDPEVFIDCMEHLKLQPWECIAFEDAAAGIEAIQAANIAAVGIGRVLNRLFRTYSWIIRKSCLLKK